MFELTDRVAVVTGGSRGLGQEMVRAFARQGAKVVIASRKLDACQRLADEVRAETGRETLPVACHVGHWDDCEALVEAAYQRFGRVDVLVNNAGMSPLYPSLDAVSEELFFVLENALDVLCCQRYDVFEAGDHSIILGRVVEIDEANDGEPVLYYNRSYRSIGEIVARSPRTPSDFSYYGNGDQGAAAPVSLLSKPPT